MLHTCSMCGHSFDANDDFGSVGPIVCPACGTTTGGTAAVRAAGDKAQVARRVQAPAIALMVVGTLTILNGLAVLAMIGLGVFAGVQQGEAIDEEAMIGFVAYGVGALTSFIVGGIVVAGGWKMYQLQSWGWALTAAILSVIPCFTCFLIGLPIGIWSLVTLNDAEVKEAFG
jgi:hypothetical protein